MERAVGEKTSGPSMMPEERWCAQTQAALQLLTWWRRTRRYSSCLSEMPCSWIPARDRSKCNHRKCQQKATLGGGKSRAHCDPRWRTHNDLNAATTGPAVWAPGYYLSQYFSESEKEEERKKKKKLCSIYEGSSIPSTVKVLYQGFRSCSATITCKRPWLLNTAALF